MTAKKSTKGAAAEGHKRAKLKSTQAPSRGTAQPKASPKQVTALSAAARVLKERARAMTCPELIEAMAKKGYWTSPNGKTPASTLYAAILREIAIKGAQARFKKTDRGTFAGTGVA